MNVDTEIYTALSNASTVTDITGTQLFPVEAPLNTPVPFVFWSRIATVAEPAHDEDGTDTLFRTTFQFNCVAGTFDQMDTLTEAVRQVLAGATAVGQSTLFESRRDAYDLDSDRHTGELDFAIWH